MSQTRPPAEIIVVDASPDWDKTRDLILQRFEADHPRVKWVYVQAEEASSATQRNQGIRIATSDIIFFLDDDTLIHPDAAEQVMRIYEADTEEEVVSVALARGGIPKRSIFSDPEMAKSVKVAGKKARGGSKDWLRKRMQMGGLFVPYDEDFPANILPESVAKLNVKVQKHASSDRLTARRDVLMQEQFNPILKRYASGEDVDLTYRLTRHGALVFALDALAHHMEVAGGRLPVRLKTLLGSTNHFVMHRLYSTDLKRSERRLLGIQLRRILLELGKDLHYRNFSLPRARGTMRGTLMLHKIMRIEKKDLHNWYVDFQTEMLKRNP